ncbi:MAG: acetyl-CoA carboxylase biotin carboxylase subunit, partial [Acidobacteriota bacterium]
MVDFDKVLVANRGEIARRVFRTLRDMGLATVAVYSDADSDAPHVAEADEAVRLGPAPSAQSYLDQDAVFAAAQAVGAHAIHPGYGFLSENADFAERCAQEGLVFIGPSPQAIRSMGDKAAAKELANEAGVPILDGFRLEESASDTFHERAAELGFPLLIKAAAGGGGKGMRVVSEASELDDAASAARREAEAAFGDGSLLIERFLSAPRHVEVQVLGDAHGNVVHLFERDCSVQRRHQKVFEESPSPAVEETLRARMGEAAVALAHAVDYQGAGTVEFLLDETGAFYFLEMNTRLQVEHPVTEAVTGLDLVRLQVDIARDQPLTFNQDDVKLAGHAIEARLYAEDPSQDFLPATGTVSLWAVPELPGLRVDSGIEQGDTIGIHYDPMLAKVIAHGTTRDEAVRRLHRGLSELAVGGLITNHDFLLATLEHEAFRQGAVNTGFIATHMPTSARTRDNARHARAQHAIAATLYRFRARRKLGGPHPGGIPSGWRNNPWRPQEQAFDADGERRVVHYHAEVGNQFTMQVTNEGEASERQPQAYRVRLIEAEDGRLVAEIDGVRRQFHIGEIGQRVAVHGAGCGSELEAISRFPQQAVSAVAGGCAAPMTGRIVEVRVAAGQQV